MEISQLIVGLILLGLGVFLIFIEEIISLISGIFLVLLAVAVFLNKENEIERIKYFKSKKNNRKKR